MKFKEKSSKCKFCAEPATLAMVWAEGMAYVPCCEDHVVDAKNKVTDANGKPDPSEVVGVYEFPTGRKLDLADADIEDTDTMVALMLPEDVAKSIAVEGGVPVEDIHCTVTFHGELDDTAFADLVAKVRSLASVAKPLSGSIGGLGTFPADDPEAGAPWWVPVDVPGLAALHEDLLEVSDTAKTNHGYSPHITLTYVKEGDQQPSPVDRQEVAFSSVWVVRGNEERVEVPFGEGTSAEPNGSATLGSSDSDVELAEGTDLNVLDLAERAKSIADPELRKEVMTKVVDLAMTKDGRQSYKNQGKWGHGFVPLDEAAKKSKAKGSPIAMKRMNRLFGGAKRRQKEAAAKDHSGPPSVKAEGGNTVTASRATLLRGAKTSDIKRSQRVKNSQFEKNKVGRVDARASRPWDEVPADAKVVRNGKRYVVSRFGDEQVLTEWTGGVVEGETKNTTKYASLTAADAADLSTGELRKILKDPKMSKQARQVAYKALQDKIKKVAKTA